MPEATRGTVFLVGAGPGDPGLLTVRGQELLGQADIVVYDYLADPGLLNHCSEAAKLVDVGKRPDRPTPQHEINSILIESALKVKCVVRLKGGDPFVFGRGGEEALALTEAGIAFEIVPGVSSAIAVPAYAGIPVTHRGFSTSFSVVTGHRHGKATDQVDWGSLAKLGGTIIILMGVAHRREIAEKLMRGGLDPATPVAAVRWGTRSDQVTVRTNLAGLGVAQVMSPSTIVVGSVAALDLKWFENKRLFGKKVIITRSQEQTQQLRDRLAALGAHVVSIPTITFAAPPDAGHALLHAASNLDQYQWIIFTSANAVRRFFSRIRDARELAGVKVAAIGKATSRAILDFNIVCDFVPSEFVAETFVAEFPAGNGSVLFPRAVEARDTIPEGLQDKGWRVEIVDAYCTVAATMDPQLKEEIEDADAIAFTSSSGVSSFLAVYSTELLPSRVVSIGPVTTATLREHLVTEVVTASRHDIDGLVDALVQALA